MLVLGELGLNWISPSNPINSKYLLIAMERTHGFSSFPRALTWIEMQTSLSKIWTSVTDFIYYDNNCYNECASINWCSCIFEFYFKGQVTAINMLEPVWGSMGKYYFISYYFPNSANSFRSFEAQFKMNLKISRMSIGLSAILTHEINGSRYSVEICTWNNIVLK